MAAYQGARPRSAMLPGGIALPWPARPTRAPRDAEVPVARPARRAADTGARRGARVRTGSVRLAVPRPHRVGTALAAIVVLFSLGFVSLSQSVRVAATSYDLVRLQSEQDRLEALRLDIRSDIDRLGSVPAVRKLALDDGLGQLGAPVIVEPR